MKPSIKKFIIVWASGVSTLLASLAIANLIYALDRSTCVAALFSWYFFGGIIFALIVGSLVCSLIEKYGLFDD